MKAKTVQEARERFERADDVLTAAALALDKQQTSGRSEREPGKRERIRDAALVRRMAALDALLATTKREAFKEAAALFDYPTKHFRTPEDDHEAMTHAVEDLRALAAKETP